MLGAHSSQPGVEIVHDPQYGKRTLVTRSFNAGDVIINEQACLIWETTPGDTPGAQAHHDLAVLHTAFLKATKHSQERVLDMFRPEKDDPRMKNWRKLAIKHLGSATHPSVDLITQLLAIVNFNCHVYRGEAAEPGETIIGSDEWRSQPSFAALFDIASKVEHSCDANVWNRTAKGAMIYTALRDIKEGEFITFSYIGAALDWPRSERQEMLQATKDFKCACERCQGPDLNRPFWCTALKGFRNSCPGLALQGADGKWACGDCGAEFGAEEIAESLVNESNMFSDLNAIQDSVADGYMPPDIFSRFASVRDSARCELPRMHYFWAKYWEMLSTARGSEAIMLESYPTGVSSKNSRLQSALSTCELVAWKNEMQEHVSSDATKLPSQLCVMSQLAKKCCGACGKAEARSTCSNCKVVAYCNRECQSAKWDDHKTACKAYVGAGGNAASKDLAVGAFDTAKEGKKRLKASLANTPCCQDNAKEAFYAGLDFEKAGEEELAAMMLEPFETIVCDWLQPGDPKIEIVRAIVKRGRAQKLAKKRGAKTAKGGMKATEPDAKEQRAAEGAAARAKAEEEQRAAEAAAAQAEQEGRAVESDAASAVKEQLAAGNIQDAFMTAVSAGNLAVVEFCCKNAELEDVFHGDTGCVLSQTVLVCLTQQLGNAMKAPFVWEVEWLQEILLCIDPHDKDVGSHVKAVRAGFIEHILETLEGLEAGKEKRRLSGLLLAVRGLSD